MGIHAPILICALAVVGLLVAEYRDSRVGLWLTEPLASAAFIWLGKSRPADMLGPVRTYMLVIGVMSALACAVSAAGGSWVVAVRALAFTASDISVASDRFVRHRFINPAWGLPLYYTAQLLLATTPALI